MNILALVFSMLLILSYGFYATWDKQTGSMRLRSTYLGHQAVHRKILNDYQREVYKGFRSEPSQPKKEKSLNPREPSSPKKIAFNRECAKINLWPLIQEGKERHLLLYEISAKMLRTFYADALFNKQKGMEYSLLDALLGAAKGKENKETALELEKLSLNDADFQVLYYKMLKGTKKWDLSTKLGLPPLLDYLKADPKSEKICFSHAHPDLLTVLLGQEAGSYLYSVIHTKGTQLTQELVETACKINPFQPLDPALFELIELGHSRHSETKKILVREDEKSAVCLRKNLFFQGDKGN